MWDLAFRTVASVVNIEPATTGICGNTVYDRWKHILEGTNLKLTQPISDLVAMTHTEFVKNLDKLELTEGFWPFIAELKLLKKLNLALVTNTSRVVTDKAITHLELQEVFDFVICGDEVKNPKPDPEIYKGTLAHFKLQPKEALAFEDSLIGCTSAAKAGIKIICVWDEETPKRKFPDEVLEFTHDFTPFPGEMDTTYFDDIQQMAKEQVELQKLKT